MKTLFIALLIALPATILAQTNYHEGYVIKNNGDTLKGFIDYREWAYSPVSVDFKLNKTDNEVKEFTALKIRGFGIFGGEVYASFAGLISMNKNVFPDIPTKLDTTRKPGAIFMKQLATGDHLTLYTNAEVDENRFFIAGKNEVAAELKYYDYYGATKSQEVTDNLYRGQLMLYVYKYNNGDKKLLAAIADVRFEQEDLVDIIARINNIEPGSKMDSLRKANTKSIVRFFGGVGLNQFTSTVNSSSQNVFKPKFDFGMDVFINPDIQQFVFRTEVGFSFFGTHFSGVATGGPNTVDFSYAGSYFTITPQILFNVYNTEKFKVYIDGGLGFRAASYSSNDSNGILYVDNSPTGFYIPLQVGVIINNRFELSFTYTSLTTSASYSVPLGVTDKLSTTLGVKIFIN